MSVPASTAASPESAFQPPERLLAGPGPSNVDPRVLAAMGKPVISHLDPVFWDELLALGELIGRVYQREDGVSLCLSQTGTSGMEAGIVNLVEPGDTVIAASSGFFGNRIVEMLRRRGAEIVELREDFGRHVPNERILATLAEHPDAVMVCVVHAETSTGVAHPVAELGTAMRASGTDALLFTDCVTALGGIRVAVDEDGVDYAYSCSQKCLAAPAGLSPITISNRALERMRARTTPVPYALDLLEHLRYWFDRPVTYHHTTPNVLYYALDAALRILLDEGLEASWARHAEVGGYLQDGFRARGFDLLADPAYQLPQLTAVRVPDGVDGKAIQGQLLERFSIEVGGGLGPDAPPIWRIGMMGYNCNRETADRVLEAFDAVLPSGGS